MCMYRRETGRRHWRILEHCIFIYRLHLIQWIWTYILFMLLKKKENKMK